MRREEAGLTQRRDRQLPLLACLSSVKPALVPQTPIGSVEFKALIKVSGEGGGGAGCYFPGVSARKHIHAVKFSETHVLM